MSITSAAGPATLQPSVVLLADRLVQQQRLAHVFNLGYGTSQVKRLGQHNLEYLSCTHMLVPPIARG